MTAALSYSLPRTAVYTSEPLFPLTVDAYHELIRAGKLYDDDPVELLEGMLVHKIAKSPLHSVINAMMRQPMEALLPGGFHYHSQDPVTLADGEPEPDGCVVRGQFGDYMARHPGPNEVPLVIEVADASLDRDRGIKLRSYARGQIAEYWIVNLVDQQIEVYTNPDPAAAGGPTYGRKAVYGTGASVPLNIDGRQLGDLPVGSLLAWNGNEPRRRTPDE
jgi:Uma2 family endonuclease